MKKRAKQLNYYPTPNRQYHSYGIRYWNGEKWMYWGSKYSKNKGHVEQWLDNDYRCWTTTGLLSAMLKSQGLSTKSQVVVEVIQFEEPKVMWHAWYKNRPLELGEFEK
jgi:hypothetical protein